ncbi:immunity 50 family protein [Chromobacterium aquaticum]|uniref:Immunity 50 family protein n=1 Tax=Chromobacterium aquaticum TaxID=467180 RepID=A0ABV8ZS01_9NEIS|nr:immunity 50 family protein [Chromobacterium aquaticum]MCD5362662.1 immunity 50 family protein [Chromobacterium aquaticum]
MDLLNRIARNTFLLDLFPSGLEQPLFLGQISLDVGGRLSFKLHTRQRPAMEVRKWGQWERDYNTIVIKLFAHAGADIRISNWREARYCALQLEVDGETLRLKQASGAFSLELALSHLLFQECSVYMDGADEEVADV